MVVKKEINHDHYLEVLTTSQPAKRTVTTIRSQDHQVFTMKMEKIALTPFYDKLKMLNYLENVPYGYDPAVGNEI